MQAFLLAGDDADPVVGRGREILQRGRIGEAVTLDEGEDRGAHLIGRPFAEPLDLRQGGNDIGVDAVVGCQLVGLGRRLEGNQPPDLAVRGTKQGLGAGCHILVQNGGKRGRVGKAHQPQLDTVARHVAIEVRVVLGGHTEGLQPRQLLDGVCLPQLEVVDPVDLFGPECQEPEAAVGHGLDLTERSVGKFDSDLR